MNRHDRGYFELAQAREVAEMFAKHQVDFLFIGKGGAIILGYPATTQDVDIFPRKTRENGQRIIDALIALEFEISETICSDIIDGKDFIQINDGPFDIDLVFAPDGIESYEIAAERMVLVEGFPVANIRDIIASKKAAGRQKDMLDLPLLEDFRDEYENSVRLAPKTDAEAAERLKFDKPG